MKDLKAELKKRKDDHLYRQRRVMSSPQGSEVTVDGRQLLAFCSNDYLGLSHHPVVATAMKRGIERYGVGSGAAHLITGHTEAHHALEEELAEFVGRPRALLLSTGYMANLGVISALTDRGDTVFEDRLNHASLIDGGMLSRAAVKRFHHGDMEALSRQLKATDQGNKLVVTDGVFSMDGDTAPLVDMARICRKHDAWLMVDDAHGFGVLGPDGQGTLSDYGLGVEEAQILVGTLGKAVGTFGAFVAGTEDLIETMIQQARPYIYTTAPPPAVAEATRAALKVIQTESWRRERLVELVKRFRKGARELGLILMPSETPIQPILLGESKRVLEWSRQLEQAGILVSAIRPPTVPEGMARLRITFSADHSEADVDRLLASLEAVAAWESK